MTLDTGATALDTLSRRLLGDRVSFVIPTLQLPFGQHVNSVTAGPYGVRITASGTDVIVSTEPPGTGHETSATRRPRQQVSPGLAAEEDNGDTAGAAARAAVA